MSHLLITIRFLDGRYHGRDDKGPEWPPSPMRLFQAIVAGAKARWSDSVREALLWLERQPPPTIRAPFAKPGQELLTYVPNNNSDSGVIFRTAKQFIPTMLRHERHVDFVWNVSDGDQKHAQAVADAARHIRCLGWGIDLAIGHGRVVTTLEPPPEKFDVHVPQLSNLGEKKLRVPVEGSLASLETSYKTSLNRVQPNGELRDEPGSTVFLSRSYSCDPVRPFCAFAFETEDEEPVSFHTHQLKELAGMIRHLAASESVRKLVGDEMVNTVICGHPKDATGPRLSILPLPSIGHPHSNGRIQRVVLAEAVGETGDVTGVLGELLHNQRLQPLQPGPLPPARLRRLDREDKFIRRWYCTRSHTWASVTPVLLPGYDDRKQHRGDQAKRLGRAAQLVGKALAQAGIPVPAELEVSRVPYWPGTFHSREYEPREKLSHYPRYHVMLTFKRPMSGPLSIGAGRHVGFGTLAALQHGKMPCRPTSPPPAMTRSPST